MEFVLITHIFRSAHFLSQLSFFVDSHERVLNVRKIHPNTSQMIELMCLNKIKLLRISFNKPRFGVNRETVFDNWPCK